MPTLITQPTRVEAAGNKPKLIDEFFGRVNTGDSQVSIAHMRSPGGLDRARSNSGLRRIYAGARRILCESSIATA